MGGKSKKLIYIRTPLKGLLVRAANRWVVQLPCEPVPILAHNTDKRKKIIFYMSILKIM